MASQIYEVLALYIYRNIDDERLHGVQITAARMTNDLSIARIYFYVDGGKDRQGTVFKVFEELKPELRHHIGQEIVLKTLPKLEFYLDEGIKNAERIEEILKGLK